jgi:hypothetical protein
MLAHGAETAEQMSLLQDTILGQVLNAIRDALKATPAQQADSVHALIRSQLQRANILPVIAQFYQEEAQLDKTEDTPENYQAHHIAVAGTDAATGTASQARVDFGGYARAVVTCKNMQTISNQLGIELPAAATATLSSNLAAISTAWSAKPQLASHRADRRARAESAPPPLPPITARLSSIRFTTAPAAMATAKEVKAALAKLQQTLNGVSKPGQIDPDIYMKAAGELGKLNAELYGGEIDSPQPTSVLDRINETHKSLMKDIAAYLQQQSSRVRLGQAC